jgi:hypothetical protein
VLAQFSADLIGGDIAPKLRHSINRSIQMNALAGNSSIDAMRDITDALFKSNRPPTAREPVKGIAYEAERILRTETNRAYSVATNAQQEKLAEDVPGLQKQWMATGDARTRLSHLNAHGQVVDVGKPFIVGPGKAELMFPSDPAGPPQETINCRCRSITVIPEIGPLETPLDAEIEAEKERRGIEREEKAAVAAVPAAERDRFRRFEADPFGGEDDIADWAQNASYDAWNAGLSSKEREWLALYKQEGYEWINTGLRGDFSPLDEIYTGQTRADFKNAKKFIDQSIKRHRLPNDITLWRGGSHPELTKMLESGRSLDDLVGIQLGDDAYMSTSLNGDSADDFVKWAGKDAFRFEIQAPRGTFGAYIEYMDPGLQEYEFLLARGSKLEILEATMQDGIRNVLARVIAP